ncbi:MAG: DUF3341 domain-containing protein [Acidobacteriota bacterium]
MPKPLNTASTQVQAIEQFKERLGIGRDKTYAAMGSFSSPEDLVAAGKKIYGMGYRKLDAMTPFPVHGIDDALGIPRSHLGWIVVCFAMLGLLTAQGLMYYVGVINYPLIIGGKPLFDFTFTIPVTFELTVLFAGISATVGIFAVNGLPQLYHPAMNYKQVARVTDDRFVLVVEADDPKFNAAATAADLRSIGAQDVEVVEG